LITYQDEAIAHSAPIDNSVEKKYLLTAAQMAQFVTDGFLMVENLVPEQLNRAVHRDQQKGIPGHRFWRESENIQTVFELPQVKGILQSFLGTNPVYDHSFLHIVQPEKTRAQNWHADSIIDLRPLAFDVQSFYFAHDTPKEMGPTLILPGSHLRRVNTESIGRYKNIIGQRQLEAKAGTIVFMHHGIWHCAQPNFTETTRYVFKLRLQPGQEQRGLFNTDDIKSEEVTRIINRDGYREWQGNEARLEHNMRAHLWRYVTGDDTVDESFEKSFYRMSV
jgi:ectoine hydroxylase-related dioxygenase (phytanoyl-CoA dioxygenase family)